MAASLGSLVVSLGLDAADYIQGLTKAEQAAAQFNASATKHFNDVGVAMNFLKGTVSGLAGALTVGAITAWTKSIIDAQDHLNDLSKSTGIAVDVLGGFGFAASQSGSSLDGIGKAVGKLNLQIAAATAGNKTAREGFDALGISMGDLKTLSVDQIFAKIADAFASYEDGPNKAALGNRFFAKSYQDIIPTLDEGGRKLQENIEYFKKYGGVNQEVAARADQFNDTLVKLQLLSGAFGRTLVAELIGPMQALADEFVDVKEKGDRFQGAAKDIADVIRGVAVAAIYGATEISALGHGLGAIAAEAVAAAKFNFAEVGRIEEAATADQVERFKRRDALIKAISAGNSSAPSGAYDPRLDPNPPPKKKKAPSLGAGNLPAEHVDDPAKKVLAGQLKAEEAYIAAEKSLLATREEYLNHFYAQGYLSIKAYYDDLAGVRKLALDHEEESTAREIKLLEARNRVPKSVVKGDLGLTDSEKQENLNKIADYEKKLGATRSDAAKKEFLAQQQQTIAAQAYADTLGEINARTLELAGNTAAATKIRFDAANRVQLRVFDAPGNKEDPASQAAKQELIALGKQQQVQAALNDEQKKFARITEDVSIAQERINLAQSTGAISEITALQQTSDLNKSRLRDLTVIADAYAQIALQSQDPADIQKAQRLRLEIEKLSAATDLVADKFNKIFGDSFASAFDDVISGTKSVKDAFKDMEKSIVQSINKIASQMIADSLFGKGGGASGAGGFLASLFGTDSGSSSTYGMNDRGTGTSGGGGWVAGLASLFSGFFASGGNPSIGKVAVVGENGPELFVPKVAGTIVANDSAFGGKNITIHGGVNVNVPAGTSRASADQIGAAVAAQLSRASRRNA